MITVVCIAAIALAVPGSNDFLSSTFNNITVRDALYTNRIHPYNNNEITIDGKVKAQEIETGSLAANELRVQGNLNVSGSINAREIGAYNVYENSTIVTRNSSRTYVNSCPDGEYIISCSGALETYTNTQYNGSFIGYNSMCSSYFSNYNNRNKRVFQTLVCFDPNTND